jgi:hypothetical protein
MVVDLAHTWIFKQTQAPLAAPEDTLTESGESDDKHVQLRNRAENKVQSQAH